MSTDEVVLFHRDSRERFLMAYYPRLAEAASPLERHVMLGVLAQLRAAFPRDHHLLQLLQDTLAWSASIGPVGIGAR